MDGPYIYDMIQVYVLNLYDHYSLNFENSNHELTLVFTLCDYELFSKISLME